MRKGRNGRSTKRRDDLQPRPDRDLETNSNPDTGTAAADIDGLVEFLREEFVADESRLRSALRGNEYTTLEERIIAGIRVSINQEHSIPPASDTNRETQFLLAELHAKREILDLWNTAFGGSMPDFFGGYEAALRRVYLIMAQPYAHRAGFRSEWHG